MPSTEIIFEVTEDETDGGYSASALGYGIHTQRTTGPSLPIVDGRTGIG